MKKNFILILITFFFLSEISAQQLPLYSQYMFNNYLLNSAACGTTDYSMIKLNYRDQWSGFGNDAVGGFDPSPKTYSISFNKGLTNHSAIGFIVAQDQILPIQNTSLQVTYAYRFALSNKLYMSLAISPVYSILSFDNDIIEPDDITDPLYTDVSTLEMIGMENSSNIDFNFGMYLFNDRFDFGLSIANLAENEYPEIGLYSEIYTDEDTIINTRTQHLFLHSSYDFQIDWAHSLSIVPSILLKSTWVTKPQLDINLKFIYMDYFWIGSSFRTSDNVVAAMCGINSEKLFLGYSYDLSTSSLSSFHSGTHAFTLGLYFNASNENKHVRKRNRFSEIRRQPAGGWFYWYSKSKW